MSYRVVITQNAKANLRAYFSRAAEDAPETAARWLARFEGALATLAENPQRCVLAHENDAVPSELRQLVFGKGRSRFRALFTIAVDEVQILHIRRGAMDWASPDELFG